MTTRLREHKCDCQIRFEDVYERQERARFF